MVDAGSSYKHQFSEANCQFGETIAFLTWHKFITDWTHWTFLFYFAISFFSKNDVQGNGGLEKSTCLYNCCVLHDETPLSPLAIQSSKTWWFSGDQPLLLKMNHPFLQHAMAALLKSESELIRKVADLSVHFRKQAATDGTYGYEHWWNQGIQGSIYNPVFLFAAMASYYSSWGFLLLLFWLRGSLAISQIRHLQNALEMFFGNPIGPRTWNWVTPKNWTFTQWYKANSWPLMGVPKHTSQYP